MSVGRRSFYGHSPRVTVLLAIALLGAMMLYLGLWPRPVPFDGLNEKRLLGIAGDHWLHFISFTLLTILTPHCVAPSVPLRYAASLCMVAAVGSEAVQGMFPWRRFDWHDIVANICGVVLGVTILSGRRRMRETAFEPVDSELV